MGTALATVQNWCRHLTSNGTFSTTTAPTLAQVQDWLTIAQSDVMMQLLAHGFGTTAPTNQNGLAWLEKMNCLRACMNVEMTYPVTEWGKPNERMAAFKEQWDEGIALMEKPGALASIGLEESASGSLSSHLEFTGTSLSRKQSREAEEDRVAGKFQRNFGRNNRITPGYFDPNQA